jgi:uncharacterized repeat protein (TIGR01451 family)
MHVRTFALSLLIVVAAALLGSHRVEAATCAPATSAGNAPSDWASFCWLDFSGYSDTQALSAAGQPFTFTLSDGSTLNLTLKAVSTAASGLRAVPAPSWSGAAVGNTAFIGIPGAPVLYTSNNASTVTVSLSNIRVTPPTGVTATTGFALVAADAESTNGGESITLTTNGAPWTVLDQVPPISGSTYPTMSSAGTTVTETGAAGNVGGYIFGTANSPTNLTAKLVAGGLQGVMFAVRYAWVSVNKTLVSTRIATADQFRYSVLSTAAGAPVTFGTSTGSGNGAFTRALVSVASGYPLTISESMAAGSTSPLSNYVSSLTCTNANPSSTTSLPNAALVSSFSLGTLAYGDGITCMFTNTPLPRVTLAKALTGPRVFAADQFALKIANGSTAVATTVTTGTGSQLTVGATPTTVVAAAQPYLFSEDAAGTTVLNYYNAAMTCVNAFAGSTTTLPTLPGGSVNPKVGDNITCTITNTPKPPSVSLNVQKSSTVVTDPTNGIANPKRIPGSTVRYAISVTNTGTAPVDAGALVVTDVIPSHTSLLMKGLTGAPADFVDGTPPSGLSFNTTTGVTYSNQPGGGPPYTYVPVPNGAGIDAAVTGLRIAPTGAMAGSTTGGQPRFTVSFQVVVD